MLERGLFSHFDATSSSTYAKPAPDLHCPELDRGDGRSNHHADNTRHSAVSLEMRIV